MPISMRAATAGAVGVVFLVLSLLPACGGEDADSGAAGPIGGLLDDVELSPEDQAIADAAPVLGQVPDDGSVREGKRDALMRRPGLDPDAPRWRPEQQAAESAGVLGALRDAKDLGAVGDGTAGEGALAKREEGTVGKKDPAATQAVGNGIGGLVGEKHTQVGAGGLAVRGSGLGGGGSAEGIGGLGTRGRGSGASGYGSGGGSFAAKGAGVARGYEAVPVVQGAPMTGDSYDGIAENDFHVVDDQPLSTFSIDVDTASYSNVRRYLQEGTSPPRDAVRIEELLNYFAYDYTPPPAGGAPFASRAEVTDCPWAAGHKLVRVGLKGREAEDVGEVARNLVFLVDVSGSMASADRLPLVQRGLDLLAGQLGPRDRVSMVVYAGAAGVVLEPTPGDHTAAIQAAITRLRAGGSTAGGEGIRKAYALAREHFDPKGINRVILATDGDFNVGTTSEAELTQLIEAERKSGVFLTVLGFGRGNLQDDRLEALADKGNGNYAYIDGYAELRKVLGTQVGGTLVTLAKDVKIQVEFNPRQVSAYRLIGYENRVLANRDFNDDTKDAGEIGAGHTVTAMYEVIPAQTPIRPEVDALTYQGPRESTYAALSGELLTVKLRYKAPDGDVSELLSFPVRDEGTPFARASRDTRWAAAVAGFGMLLRDSPHRGEVSWAWVQDTAREALGNDVDGFRAEFLSLVAKARVLGPAKVVDNG